MILTITTCQAANTFAATADLVAYMADKRHIHTRYVDNLGWVERYAALDRGEIQVAWICGWPYVQRRAAVQPVIKLLAAPVMAAGRYRNQPIYFSDVVVRHDAPYQTFADLRGATWAYNEPGSQSGCHIVRHHLAQLGHFDGYFGQAIASGGHLRSLDLIHSGRVDGAAIDSTVLDWELARRPELADKIRVVEILGPSAIPPLVVHTSLPSSMRHDLRALLLDMHTEADGRRILAEAGIQRFVHPADADYDLIREMGRVAKQVKLVPAEKLEQPDLALEALGEHFDTGC